VNPRFGFAAHPEALDDLAALPTDIQELALLGLQQLVYGLNRGQRLDDRLGPELDGARKLYVDPKVGWRIVYREQPAPPGSAHRREIFLIAVGPRSRSAVYHTAAARLRALAHAALRRSATATPAGARDTACTARPTTPQGRGTRR
jgi:mRNA interferase RelE/StbE